MSQARLFRLLLPPSVRPAVKGLIAAFTPSLKYQEEIHFWRTYQGQHGGVIPSDHYVRTMTGMLGTEPSTLTGKIVADFGCGPAGSLNWATSARLRIGIDALADHYAEFGISTHDMTYVTSTERHIPLPSNYVDVLFTMNAMDHVSHFKVMCKEVLRIISPGGLFVASFNLDEQPTFSEPQTLTEAIVKDAILSSMDVEFYRIEFPSTVGSTYENFFNPGQPSVTTGTRFLWVRARKRS